MMMVSRRRFVFLLGVAVVAIAGCTGAKVVRSGGGPTIE